MNIGVFLLIEPFASVEKQLERAKEMGFDHADITDTNAGGSMLGTAGFSPTVSLDGNPDALGVNLDTGNSWLGGADPVEMAKAFKNKIYHIHWKNLGAECEPKRGTLYGCGFSTIALGDGVIDIKGVCEVLKDADIESSTLEIIGSEDILKRSAQYLQECGL